MKTQIMVFLVAFFVFSTEVFSQRHPVATPNNTNHASSPDTATLKQLVLALQQIDNTSKKTALNIDSIKNNFKDATKTDPCKICGDIGAIGWIVVLSPFILFLIALLAIKKSLKDFNLKDALTDDELPKITKPNPQYNLESLKALAAISNTSQNLNTILPPTIEVSGDTYPKSSSRYIAFLTSVLTLIIALSLCTLFIYRFLLTGKGPDLSGLSNVLLALGIGVVPYAFNKISSAIK